MDEKVTVNLGCFFCSRSLCLWLCSLRSLHLLLLFHHLPLISFPVNTLPNKLAPNVPSNILKNPPVCSLV